MSQQLTSRLDATNHRASCWTALTLVAVMIASTFAIGPEFVTGFSGLLLSSLLVSTVITVVSLCCRSLPALPLSLPLVSVPLFYTTLAFAFFVFGEAIDQPHPRYEHGTWFTVALQHAASIAPVLCVAFAAMVGIDIVVQSPPTDIGYYPKLANIWTALGHPGKRLPFIGGMLIVYSYYATSVVSVWHSNLSSGLVWPPKRVFATCMLLWSIAWVTDCLVRPKGGTRCAAGIFLIIAVWLWLGTGVGVLRE